MGSFLDKPVTEKASHEGSGNGLLYAASCMQGWRVEMEVSSYTMRSLSNRRQQDAHILEGEIAELPGISFFSVFDGHGGSLVANFRCCNFFQTSCSA